MADSIGGGVSGHPNLNLTAEEKRAYGQLFRSADPDGFDVVSGDVAVKFFEKTKLPPDVLGQIWQIADTENRGLLTPSGFGVVLRLIGHAQAGRAPSAELATQPGPLPRFDGLSGPPLASQNTGPPQSPAGPPPIRVPPLAPERVAEYSSLFEKLGAQDGILPGSVAKQIFERARLPNEVLGRIWNLSDTQGRGALDTTEFVIAMHLLASYKVGVMRGVPNSLPPGLYEAASRRLPLRTSTGSRPGSGLPPAPGIQPQFSGFGSAIPQSPITRHQAGTPLSAQSTGEGWLIGPADKAKFDSIFATVDKQNRGFITGDQAVEFFGNARLPEEALAQIWDLADINSEGQLNRDEFAVAMYLIRQQRGSKDGRGNLPPTLPAALVPPSMRRQHLPPSQPTAPAFENAPVTRSRSAADDLFGLDGFNPPAPATSQVQQSTGGSTSSPFQTSRSPPPAVAPSPPASTTFKPFIPSSLFGQSLTPQASGQTRGVAPQTHASDDLLGDGDPEVSQKLTSETAELANLSNQVGSLSKQMTEVQGNRAQAEQDLAKSSQQKREFETRLAQLRTMYEQEVKDFKALQERLTASQADTKRLQQEMAVTDGSRQDLQNQHQELKAAFEADQQENAAIKEKIRVLNAEVNELKLRLEKLKGDARQQRGLVVISKKQLATLEAERDRLQSETATASKELDEATKEAEELSKVVELARNAPPASEIVAPTQVKSPVATQAVSPTPSTSSNPFFRRATLDSAERPPTAPTTNREATNESQNSFDNIFGPSFPINASSTPPPVSFGGPAVPHTPERASVVDRSSEAPRSFISSTNSANLPEAIPPPPPQSRQITSASLPFRAPLNRTDSISSSVKVAPPASRLSPADTPGTLTPSAATPGTLTPSAATSSPMAQHDTDKALPPRPREDDNINIRETSPFENTTLTPSANTEDTMEHMFEKATNEKLGGIPGAFPDGDTPRASTPLPSAAAAMGAGVAALATGGGIAALATHEHEHANDESSANEPEAGPVDGSSNRDSTFDSLFGGPAYSRSESEKAADFDSAFADMKNPTANGDANTSNKEFPPIRELEDADDSDDDREALMAFEDNFNTTSPPRAPKIAEPAATSTDENAPAASAIPTHLAPPRPGFPTTSSATSSLPGIEAQGPPPSYGESVPKDDPSHFPPEFKGLLPKREDPRSPPLLAEGSTSNAISSPAIQPPYGPETVKSPPLEEPPPVIAAPNQASTHDVASEFADKKAPPTEASYQPRSTSHDFDSAFAGLSAAPVEDDDDDEPFNQSQRNAVTEFDPSFDSPRETKSISTNAPPSASIYSPVTNGPSQTSHPSTNNSSNATNEFHNFDITPQAATAMKATSAAPPAASISHDWDAIFAGLDTPAPETKGTANDVFGSAGAAPAATASASPEPPSPTPAATSAAPKAERPAPGRALSDGTEHDDPILKRLTAMGWSREASLNALEKYDYNIDKAADYLTFRT